MKNLFFGMLALSIMALGMACQKESLTTSESSLQLASSIASASNKTVVGVSELPAEVRTYVDLSFTPVAIEAAWHAKGLGYEVELEDGQDLYFAERGGCLGMSGSGGGQFRCMGGDTVAVEDLPAAATDYIAANFADLTIQTVVAKPHGGFAVELSDGTILLFNAEGEFHHECGEMGGNGGGHGGHDGGHGGGHQDGDGPHGPNGGCTAGDSIDVADLPTLATDYIGANYAGETVTLAVVKPSGKFAVELSNGVVLLFDAEGNFIKECDGVQPGGPGHHHCETMVTIDDLPQAAQDYIAATYADATVDHGCLKINGNFIVELSNGAKILFDADGNVLFDSGL